MGRKASIIAALIGLAVLLGIAWRFEREPEWGGKPLSDWAAQYGSNEWGAGHGSAAHREAEKAIRAIGTNGIPFLVSQLRASDMKIMKAARPRIPKDWQQKVPFRDLSGETRRLGAYGLAALATNAAAAVPELIEIATHHQEEDGRYMSIFALRTLGPAAEPAIPLLLQCLTNASGFICGEAAMGLGAIGRQPHVVLPALIRFVKERAVSHPNNFEVRDAIGALSKFGTNAQIAGPPLISLLNHSNSNVRQEATNCLARVGLKVPGVE